MNNTFHILKRIIKDGKSYIPAFSLLGGIGLVLIPVEFYGLLLSKRLVDKGFLLQNWDTTKDILFILIILFMLRSLIRYGTSIFSNKVQFRINQTFQDELFSHILHLPVRFFTKEPTGKLMSRILDDATRFSSVFGILFGPALLNPFKLLALLGLLTYISSRMCVLMLFSTIISLLIIEGMGRRLRIISKQIQEQNATISSFIEQVFPNIELVKCKTTEKETAVTFRQLLEGLIQLSLKMLRVRLISSPLLECLKYLAVGGVFVYGSWLISKGLLTIGALTTFLGATYLFFNTLSMLGQTYGLLREDLARMEIIYGILDSSPESLENISGNDVPSSIDSVEFKEVTFGYNPLRPVLIDVSCHISHAEFLAITGQSGSGKTTLARLLLRFYEPDSGEIRLNGEPISQINLGALRSSIGIVFQENLILDSTIKENITYGNSGVSMSRIIAAAKISQAHNFIKAFPDLYDTVVGEHGKNLSGGQRQRIAIARAILTDPQILILDEATSFIELRQEEAILKRIKESRCGKITLIISHRLSAIKMAERILTLDNGRVLDTTDSQSLIGHVDYA
ncbi:MAG: ABC transporter ATP-binding protein [Deltaproteobacteria bacterium]|nr:ABC transporter ATP-binding protein [Deltaproteobacteria bacterium]